jgi:hypothetical protein
MMNLHYGGRAGESTAVSEAAYIAGAGAGMMDAVTREAAARALGTAVQLHFDKKVEKKRAAAAQKQELWRLLLFLALALSAVAGSPPARLQCRHLAFYAAVARYLRCLDGFRYRRRCHKLTLALAAHRLRMLKSRGDVEVPYQEPPESYPAKFKRSWAIHFAFLIASHSLSHPLLLVDGAQPLPPPLLLSR